MNTRIASLLAVWALAIGARSEAQELPASPSESPTTGKVLLLSNDRLMEGDIERIGDRFRVRRGASEVWVPADKAVCTCADVQEAFLRMKSRANLGDADERYRLAKWCLVNNLRDQALDEARYALELRPEHAQTKSLIAILERGNTKTNSTTSGQPTKPSAGQEPARAAPAAPPIDVNAETLAHFTQKIQPILMNTCANCHTEGRGGPFQLYRAGDGGYRTATQRNLAAVIAQLNVQKPALSPLLIKATSAHANTPNAPIQSQQAIPFRTLTAWIDRTLATNPHLRERTMPVATMPVATMPVAVAGLPAAPTESAAAVESKAAVVSRPSERLGVTEPPPASPTSPSKTNAATIPENASPRPTEADNAGPRDPFDPEIFNRQSRPKN